jgi:DNA-binding NarL/FixJ family response regulator
MHDARELSAALSALYDCVLQPDVWDTALERLTRFAGGDSASVFHQDRVAKTGDFVRLYNADPEWTRLYFQKYVALNPVIPYMAFMDVGSTTSFQRVIPQDEMLASPFYREWLQPQGYWDVVVTVLDKSATVTGMFGINRKRAQGAATEDDIARMDLIAPHMRRAVSLARLFDGLQAQNAAFRTLADDVTDAVVFLDADGAIAFANAAAKKSAEQGAPFVLGPNGVTLQRPAADRALREAVSQIRTGDIGGGAQSIDLGQDWSASIVPAGSGLRSAPGGAAAILSLRKVAPGAPAPMDALAAKFDFTPREMQVFMGIVQFGGVPEVAQMFGLAQTTVRSHLQHIFDKTGVRDQRDLIRIAMTYLGPPPGP